LPPLTRLFSGHVGGIALLKCTMKNSYDWEAQTTFLRHSLQQNDFHVAVHRKDTKVHRAPRLCPITLQLLTLSSDQSVVKSRCDYFGLQWNNVKDSLKLRFDNTPSRGATRFPAKKGLFLRFDDIIASRFNSASRSSSPSAFILCPENRNILG
jgi:hypothetical protein